MANQYDDQVSNYHHHDLNNQNPYISQTGFSRQYNNNNSLAGTSRTRTTAGGGYNNSNVTLSNQQRIAFQMQEMMAGPQASTIPSFTDFKKSMEPPSEISIHDKVEAVDLNANETSTTEDPANVFHSKKKQLEGTLESITEGIDTMPETGFIHHYWINSSWYKNFRSFFLVSDHPKIHRVAYRSSVSIFNERARHLATFPNIIHPYSIFRWYWDILLILFLIFTLIYEPVRITFYFDDLKHNTMQIQLSIWITIIFSIDIIFNFMTGFVESRNDVVNIDPTLIARNYLRSWFMIDLISTIPFDLIYLLVQNERGETELSQSDRNLKSGVRLLELCKIFRLPRVMRYLARVEVAEQINGIYIRLINLIIIACLLTHWLSCFQYLVPDIVHDRYSQEDYNHQEHSSWLTQRSIWNQTIQTKYLTSLLRTISAEFCVSLGHEDIVELEEMILMIVCILVGVVSFSLVTAQISSIILTKGIAERRYVEVIKSVNQYLKFKQIPVELQNRIQTYYEARYQRHFFNEALILESLSDSLRRDVLMFNCRRLIENVPIFDGLPYLVIYALVTKLHFEVYLPLDLIIREGTIGESMYFIEHGMITILQENGSVLGQLKDGDFFGELALVSLERRAASIIATSKCDIYRLDKTDFNVVMEGYPELLNRILEISNARMPPVYMMDYERMKKYPSSSGDHQNETTTENQNNNLDTNNDNKTLQVILPHHDNNVPMPTSALKTTGEIIKVENTNNQDISSSSSSSSSSASDLSLVSSRSSL